MNKKKWVILCIVVISCLFLGGAAWVYTSHYLASNINWTMQGYLVTADGQVQEELEFSAKGTILDYEGEGERFDRIKLAFRFPDSFRYASDESAVEYLSDDTVRDFYSYFVSSGFSYDKSDNKSVALAFALDADKEYLIMQWDDDSDLYLVAAVDQTQPTQLLEHFKMFVEEFHIFE